MAKRATPWKEGKVISIETRKGTFVLAQMLKEPFIRFYKAFREDEDWEKINVGIFDTLFVNAVTRQFLKSSNITVIKDAIPDLKREDSDVWIHQKSGNRKVKVWEGTKQEIEFLILGGEAGGSLVKKDLWWSPTPEMRTRPHPSGVIDSVILESIELNADNTIDNNELTNLSVYPTLNERLYLCYLLNKNVDPYKDLVFNREIPEDYKIAIEFMSSGSDEEKKEKILDTYFR
ncbi:hypothetical protein [Aquimarina sp. MMG016]|uniref:hypothetical protein n=1 Tax=Aquimarina sp. MMG016 TaxID=2822690 RepID=UPI001B3A44B1|nr:hypothetical protein [Aquimarina sp. MMG016]MBQ4818700.1 hypothetical protein [Aquimarina sp. MMG016]